MKRSLRQQLSVVALVIAGIASLATTQTGPGLFASKGDTLLFGAGERTQIRHIVLRLSGGERLARLYFGLSMDDPSVTDEGFLNVRITRDSDGVVLFSGSESDAEQSNLTEPCQDIVVCTELITVEFQRLPKDAKRAESVSWTLTASAHYLGPDANESFPPGASLTADIAG